MRSQRKAERKKILGTDIDVIRADRAINLTSRYLEQNKPGYIVFLNTAEILAGQEEARLADFLTRASLVLPGDQNVEDALETSLRVGDYDSYAVEYFESLCSAASPIWDNIGNVLRPFLLRRETGAFFLRRRGNPRCRGFWL